MELETMRRLHHSKVTTYYRATPFKDYGNGIPTVVWKVRPPTFDHRSDAEEQAEEYIAQGADFVQLECVTKAQYVPRSER